MALNDPQWGNKNSGGPPDLEELLRDFNKKLQALFGGKGGGAGNGGKRRQPQEFGGGHRPDRAVVVLVWMAAASISSMRASAAWCCASANMSRPPSRGRAGICRFPIETCEVVNLSQVRTVEVGYRNNVKSKMLKESLMLTDDENIIDIQFAVQYSLKDPADYLFNNRAPDETVLQAAETAIREIVGKSKMDFVLYEGREQVAAATHQADAGNPGSLQDPAS